ncbi:MAG: LysR family transcriptional regulator [Rhodospirillaceae bacterium]|nr:LysR family transcriptional regulator [Rhodospirillaceae bacterium]
MHLTLRQLKAFGAVARNLSFTRAAEELNLSQPAVSMQVKQLEGQVGQPLFEQMGKKIYLTEAGREVYHYAKEISGEIGNMEAALASLQGIEHGTLSISVATTAHYFAPKLLSIFYQRFPGVDIRLDVTNRETLLSQLSENVVDMVIMGQPPRGIEVESDEFMENPLVVIAPPDHHFAKERSIPVNHLSSETFIVREKGSGTRSAMERFFKQHKMDLKTGMEVSSDEAIKQSVQAGLGLSIMSRDATQMELQLGRLCIPDVLHFPIVRHWYVVHRKGKRLSPVATAFRDFLLNEAVGILKK